MVGVILLGFGFALAVVCGLIIVEILKNG